MQYGPDVMSAFSTTAETDSKDSDDFAHIDVPDTDDFSFERVIMTSDRRINVTTLHFDHVNRMQTTEFICQTNSTSLDKI
eukprot:UN05842